MTAPSILSDLPVVRLKPKADARAVRHGVPWLYDSDLVLDRRTKKLAPGALAVLEDAERQPLALVSVNAASKLAVRILDRDPSAVLDQAWVTARVRAAVRLRAQLFDAPFYRVIHAEADGLPGVIVDRFGEVAVIQPNAAWAEAHLDLLVEAVVAETGVAHVLKNASGRTRALEGLDDVDVVLQGAAPKAPIPVPMNGAVYMADVTGGQKTGLFYDQRPNHAFVAGLSKGARVLDVFSHVGGFSLAALAHGAASAFAVDASEAALGLATAGANLMGVSDRFDTRQGGAFDVMAALLEGGAAFDVVVCDPPAFAASRKALDKGLRAYEKTARMAADLVAPGGVVCLCSCSHAAELSKFRAACVRGIGRAGRSGRLIYTGFAGPDHPQHPQLNTSGYLKALVFAL